MICICLNFNDEDNFQSHKEGYLNIFTYQSRYELHFMKCTCQCPNKTMTTLTLGYTFLLIVIQRNVERHGRGNKHPIVIHIAVISSRIIVLEVIVLSIP